MQAIDYIRQEAKMRHVVAVEPDGGSFPQLAIRPVMAFTRPTGFDDAKTLHLEYQRRDSSFDGVFIRVAGKVSRDALTRGMALALTIPGAARWTDHDAMWTTDSPLLLLPQTIQRRLYCLPVGFCQISLVDTHALPIRKHWRTTIRHAAVILKL